MKNNRIILVLAFVLVAVVFSAVGAYAASTLGSQSDPLVTLSYVNERLYPQLVEKISEEADRAAADVRSDISKSGGNTDTYSVVSLQNGQTLTGQVGCEILLRIGSASVSASETPGLVDLTDASSINNGSALKQNHLYMVTIAGNGVKAGSSVKLVVRGDYSVQ